MPLKKGYSRATVTENYKKLRREHYHNGKWDEGWSEERAWAAAFNSARRSVPKGKSQQSKRTRAAAMRRLQKKRS